MSTLARVLLGCLLLLLTQAARADQHVIERAWLEDPSGTLGIDEVRTRPVRPYTGVLGRGYGTSAIWIRLRIDPTTRTPPRREPGLLVLRVRPVFLDDIRVYDPLSPTVPAAVTGDRRHPRADAFQGRDFLAPIPRGDAPREIWVRVVSTSTRQIDVQVVDVESLDALVAREALLYGAYVALVLILALWALGHWLFSRDALVGVFGLAQATALVYGLCLLGFARSAWPATLPAAWLDLLQSVASVVSVSAGVGFHVKFARELDPPHWLRAMHLGLLGLLPVKLVLIAADARPAALEINMLEVLCVPAVFMASVFMARGWRRADPVLQPVLPRVLVLAYYVVIVVLLGVAALHGLALAPGSRINLYLVSIHGLVTGLLMLMMLQYRSLVLQRRQRETLLALDRARLQAEQERSTREEQGKLLAMLAHELKTPLATMHMRLDARAPGNRELLRAMDEMRGVIDRCLQAAQLDGGRLVPAPGPLDLRAALDAAVADCSQPERVRVRAGEAPRIVSDRQLLGIVLGNLVENACKYAAPEHPIELDLEAHRGFARVRIVNGAGRSGLPDPARVFEKYWRSPHARRQAGTGLGLYLARELARVLGGELRYVPTGDRVVFELDLPTDAPPATGA